MTADNGKLGPEILDPTENLFRQIHPNWVQNDRVSNQAFSATKAHRFLLSTSMSSRTTAEDSFRRHTEELHCQSVGVMAVTVGDVHSQSLQAFEDAVPASNGVSADPAHAVIDMSDLSHKQRSNAAEQLGNRARARGFVFRPQDTGAEEPDSAD